MTFSLNCSWYLSSSISVRHCLFWFRSKSISLSLCWFTLWGKPGSHSSGFSREWLNLTFWLAEGAGVIGSPWTLSTSTHTHTHTVINTVCCWHFTDTCRALGVTCQAWGGRSYINQIDRVQTYTHVIGQCWWDQETVTSTTTNQYMVHRLRTLIKLRKTNENPLTSVMKKEKKGWGGGGQETTTTTTSATTTTPIHYWALCVRHRTGQMNTFSVHDYDCSSFLQQSVSSYLTSLFLLTSPVCFFLLHQSVSSCFTSLFPVT